MLVFKVGPNVDEGNLPMKLINAAKRAIRKNKAICLIVATLVHIWRIFPRRPFRVSKEDISVKPESVGISLSVLCGARCRFCPTSRGKMIGNKTMSVGIADRLFTQLKSFGFSGSLGFGDNGDFLLCRDAIAIIRSARTYFPNSSIGIFTNMERMGAETARHVIQIRPDVISFNIDGASPETYNAMKPGLGYEKVINNVSDLVKIRNEAKSGTRINVFVANIKRYLRDVEKVQCEFPDDTDKVIRMMERILGPSDEIHTNRHGFWQWAVRDTLRRDKKSHCQMVIGGRNICLVSPEGNLYLCCLDDNARLCYGNISRESLSNIWRGPRHIHLWNLIAQQRFVEVGEPCSICISERSWPSW